MRHRSKLLTAAEYIANATNDAKTASRRIFLLTTIVGYDETTSAFFDAILEAAHRGIEVVFAADMFSYAELGGHFRPRSRFSKSIQPITELRRRFKKAGVKIRWLGVNTASTLSGRTHAKWCIVDDIVYTFGGVNLYSKGIAANDFMFRTVDADLADTLVAEQQRIIGANRDGHPYRSHLWGDDHALVLVDGGLVGDSIIYRRACTLARKATSAVYVSQYCPTGKLARLLRQIDSTLYFNPWNTATSLNALAIRLGSIVSHLTTRYWRKPYLHAKCIIFTLEDGSKRAITGSHNLSGAGVWLGTKEVALETDDPSVIRQLEQFIARHVA